MATFNQDYTAAKRRIILSRWLKRAMAKIKHTGKCSICGTTGELTFEHVPPRSAFNDQPVLYQTIDQMLAQEDQHPQTGRISQRGMGSYTLCSSCNNRTGAWYGKAFAGWAYQGMRILHLTKGDPMLYFNLFLFPLRVLKQILCMFCSASGDWLTSGWPEIRKFVLDPETKYLPNDFRLFAYYSVSAKLRQTGLVVRGSPKGMHTFNEITFPPFGYVLTRDTEPPDDRYQDLTFFGRYGYNDWTDVSLKLPVLPVFSWVPSDHRTQDEIDEAVRNKRKAGANNGMQADG